MGSKRGAVALGRDAKTGKEQPRNFICCGTRSRLTSSQETPGSARPHRPFCLRSFLLREDETLCARRNVQSVCAHYQFIIQRASHTQAESRSHTLKQEKPPQDPTVVLPSARSPVIHLRPLISPLRTTQSKWRLGAPRSTAGAFSQGPIYCFPSDAAGSLCESAGREAAFCKTRCVDAALSHRGCGPRRPPVMLLYLLNNACKHSGNAFSSRSIVVISHAGRPPLLAFSRREQQQTHEK